MIEELILELVNNFIIINYEIACRNRRGETEKGGF